VAAGIINTFPPIVYIIANRLTGFEVALGVIALAGIAGGVVTKIYCDACGMEEPEITDTVLLSGLILMAVTLMIPSTDTTLDILMKIALPTPEDYGEGLDGYIESKRMLIQYIKAVY
jgi:hypothetical protein